MAIVLIRGLPGAGKTTLGKRMAATGRWRHLENDQFFERDGEYLHEPDRLGDAIDWCLSEVEQTVASGQNVVVTNVFNQLAFAMPYVDICVRYELESLGILEAKGNYGSVRGVPPEIVGIMAQRWEPYIFPRFTHLSDIEDALAFESSLQLSVRSQRRAF